MAWRGADRVALAVSKAAYLGLVSMVSGTGLAVHRQRAPAGTPPSFQCAHLTAEKFS